MPWDDPIRGFPPWPRAVAAITAAVLTPTLLYLHTLRIWNGGESLHDLAELALVLMIYVGQSVVIAIPIGLFRWRRMRSPLIECVLLGAILAPGPLGYFGLAFAFESGLSEGFHSLMLLAPLGAVGGFIAWAVATKAGTSEC